MADVAVAVVLGIEEDRVPTQLDLYAVDFRARDGLGELRECRLPQRALRGVEGDLGEGDAAIGRDGARCKRIGD